jgi:uncharacterized protein (UPF0332 family)
MLLICCPEVIANRPKKLLRSVYPLYKLLSREFDLAVLELYYSKFHETDLMLPYLRMI